MYIPNFLIDFFEISQKNDSLKCHRLHGQTRSLLEAKQQVHRVDSVAGRAFEQVVDDSCYEQLAVDFVKVDYALVGIDHILKIGYLGGDKREVVVVEIILIELDYLRQLKVAVEIGHSHYAARERPAHRHHMEL